MTVLFDLTLIPLYRIHGQEMPLNPGLMASSAPKHVARGRENDLLVISLVLAGNAQISSDEYKQIAIQMSQRYFQVPGALTSAMRTTMNLVNQYLVERNMRTTGQGQYIIGRIILAVLRDGQLTLAQCGPTRVFHLTGNTTEAIHDAQISGRGLGIGQSVPLYLAQCDIHDGDQLVFCNHCPTTWERDLPLEGCGSLEYLRRCLLDETTDDLNGVVVGAQAGTGKIEILRGEQRAKVEAGKRQAKAEQPAAVQGAPGEGEGTPVEEVKSPPAPIPGTESEAEKAEPIRLDLQQPGRFVRPLPPRPEPSAAQADGTAAERTAHPVEGGNVVPLRERERIPEIKRKRTDNQKWLRKLAYGMRDTRLFFQRIADGIGRLMNRINPQKTDKKEGSRSSGVMILAAIAIPLMMITAAVITYYKYGRGEQYQNNYDLAVLSAAHAIEESDPVAQKDAWESALDYLDLAESYQVTEESQALRNQAEAALDLMEGVIRLEFRAAIYGGLDAEARMTQMAATGSELYLLDGVTGKVQLYQQTAQGYQIELDFRCGPGNYTVTQVDGSQGTVAVGPLVDIASMPGGNDQYATVVAIDTGGNLLFCSPGNPAEAFPLEQPKIGLGQVTGFTLSANGREMYVLNDSSIWIYGYGTAADDEEDDVDTGTETAAGSRMRMFIEPVSFFSDQPPANMDHAVDLAANGSDLFLLFDDNHIAVCTYSALSASPTACQDPATFTEVRAGYPSGATISEAVFSQLAFDAPYNTALFLLEPNAHAVLIVNPHPTSLVLAGQFHASWEMERTSFQAAPITVMAIDTNRYLYLCIGDQVYYAALP